MQRKAICKKRKRRDPIRPAFPLVPLVVASGGKAMVRKRGVNRAIHGRQWTACAVIVIALAASGCERRRPPATIVTPTPTPVATPTPTPTPTTVVPTGRLTQAGVGGPIGYRTREGWRIEIRDGAITILPPPTDVDESFRYVSRGTREILGTLELGSWAGERRSILIPGGAKLTMRGQGGQLLRAAIYDGDESHEVDVLTLRVMHSRVDTAVASSRDGAEHDGEAGHLIAPQGRSATNGPRETDWLYLGNLYSENEDANGQPGERVAMGRALGRQEAGGTAAPVPIADSAAEADEPCPAAPQLTGGLTRNADGTLTYLTRTRQWDVRIDQHTVTVRYLGASNYRYESWGDPHENLNGKHIKDWEGARRSIVLPDGTKITMHADGPRELVHTTSIYDGPRSHEIGNAGNVVRQSCVNRATANQRDGQEADGETMLLAMLRSPASAVGGLFAMNFYTESGGGGAALIRTFAPVMLGITGEADINPTQIRDYYDDPRLGHT